MWKKIEHTVIVREQCKSKKELSSPLNSLSYVKDKSVVKGKGNIEKGKEKLWLHNKEGT